MKRILITLTLMIIAMGLFGQNYRKMWQQEVNQALLIPAEEKILTESDIAHLPPLVQKYIRYTGAIGKPVVNNIHLVFSGWFKTALKNPFVKFKAEQYNFYQSPGRFYYMTLRQKGIGAKGLHVYKNEAANMKIRVAGLFTVADATGSEMNQGETVTVFNDMCLMAPAALAFANIEWHPIDSLSVKAIYSNGKNTISAILYFNEMGQLVNFVSYDRFASFDGKSYISYPWSTPVSNYREIEGRMIPSYGEAIWKMPEGDFCYGKFELQEANINIKTFCSK